MRRFVLLSLLLLTPLGRADEKYTVTVESLAPPSDVAEPIRKLLPSSCEAILDSAGTRRAEFWFRSEIPGKATAEQIKNGLTYRELVETSVLGVVRFPTTFNDYRKQEIAAGTYTLRLAFQPDTGDHNDTAPHTEFALLCPIDKDVKAEELEPKTLYKMSFASTGGEHPGVLLLYPNNAKEETTVVQDRGKGVWTLNYRRSARAESGSIPFGFAITVAGGSKLR